MVNKYSGKYGRNRAVAAFRRTRRIGARMILRKFARRIKPSWGRRRLSGFRFPAGGSPQMVFRQPAYLVQGSTKLARETFKTVLYNPAASQGVVHWVNGEPGGTLSNMPQFWQLYAGGAWQPPGGTNLSAPSEVGGSATGSAGYMIPGRMRFTHADIINSDDLKNWEYIRLDYVKIYIQYNATEYTAGTAASGMSPTFQYCWDDDNPAAGPIYGGDFERRPNTKNIVLRNGKIYSFMYRPSMYKRVVSDPVASTTMANGKSRSSFIDPNVPDFTEPMNNMYFQIRNMNLPGGTEGTEQAAFIKVWASYHYSCKRFLGDL